MNLAFPRRIASACGAAILGAALACAAAPALAGSAVTPTFVRLAAARQTGEVTFWNGGKAPVLVEASAVSWRQVDGHDVFAPTEDFVIAPMIVQVQPGSGQIFRVRPRSAAATSPERTYRLRIEDITPPQPGGGVGLRVRHDLPLVIAGAEGAPRFTFAPCPHQPASCLRATNEGTALGKITALAAQGSASEVPIPGIATILAGSWHEWPLPRTLDGRSLRIRAETDRGALTAAVTRP